MSEDSSEKVVYSGLIANIAIAVSKYVAPAVTGSSAMLAEAFHSTADAGNELLLLVGIKQSSRPPDALHPYGHGKVLYFYSLLVTVYIFGVGGGLGNPPGNLPLAASASLLSSGLELCRAGPVCRL